MPEEAGTISTPKASAEPSFAVLGAQIDRIRSVMARYEEGRLNALAVVNELRDMLSVSKTEEKKR